MVFRPSEEYATIDEIITKNQETPTDIKRFKLLEHYLGLYLEGKALMKKVMRPEGIRIAFKLNTEFFDDAMNQTQDINIYRSLIMARWKTVFETSYI